ncbi:MAG: hypothetical protein VB086_05135 [Clostridiaceae bacterium]|nr:hypothetical protein [Clostridiaceae bacterium]
MGERRKRRTAEERVAEISGKIETYKKNISALEAKKKAILNPKHRKALSLNAVMKRAKEKGYTAKDIAKKLNLDVEE